MFNVGPAELFVILLVALVVLGPDKLPDAARKVGNVMGELRRMSNGFQSEIRSAFDEAIKTPEETPVSPAKLESVADAPDTAADDAVTTEGVATAGSATPSSIGDEGEQLPPAKSDDPAA